MTLFDGGACENNIYCSRDSHWEASSLLPQSFFKSVIFECYDMLAIWLGLPETFKGQPIYVFDCVMHSLLKIIKSLIFLGTSCQSHGCCSIVLLIKVK